MRSAHRGGAELGIEVGQRDRRRAEARLRVLPLVAGDGEHDRQRVAVRADDLRHLLLSRDAHLGDRRPPPAAGRPSRTRSTASGDLGVGRRAVRLPS